MKTNKSKTKALSARAFTLLEVVTAMAILAFISITVLVAIERSMKRAIDSTQRMHAFEVARENMELLLGAESAYEQAEFGTSEKYPDINWQTTVEAFYEPVTDRMWLKGVCSAEYTDSAGKAQKIELSNWLTDLSRDQILAILQQRAQAPEQILFETVDEAAAYANVDVKTIEDWMQNGLVTDNQNQISSILLNAFVQYDGPPPDDFLAQVQAQAAATPVVGSGSGSLAALLGAGSGTASGASGQTTDSQSPSSATSGGTQGAGSSASSPPASSGPARPAERMYPICGKVYTESQLLGMSLGELMALFNCM